MNFFNFIYLQSFNLGFGITTNCQKEAGKLLMEREYPNFTKDPHDILFIPESYLYGKLAEKVSICKKNHRYTWD